MATIIKVGKQHHQGSSMARINETTGYIENIDEIRKSEYPTLNGTVYLDHAGTTPYAKSLIEAYTQDLTSNLFGNPHSASSSSQLSTTRINNVRLQVLKFFNADPDYFDVVFVANTTAAIKLVADAFRDLDEGFWFGYYADAHTSLVGAREYAKHGSRCFHTEMEVESWMGGLESSTDSWSDRPFRLIAYPGQSNMTGARHPIAWCRALRGIDEKARPDCASRSERRKIFSLYDAAALVATSPLDLSDSFAAPDFTALSFYKIFGFPDLGALIIRKDPAVTNIFGKRRYFGGGTVELVSPGSISNHDGERNIATLWHEKKDALHSMLEDGTLPFHSIIALEHAVITHQRIYGTSAMANVARHTRYLATLLYDRLSSTRHANRNTVCQLYSDHPTKADSGPTIAFNLMDSSGKWIGNSEVERLASIKNIQIRTGGLCNPGGIARHLKLSSDEMRQNFAAGQRCGSGNDIMNGQPTGAIRVSLGAMSSKADVDAFFDFLDEFFVDQYPSTPLSVNPQLDISSQAIATSRRSPQRVERSIRIPEFTIESLSVYPIKSCAAFQIPPSQSWEVLPKGLAWDREWCLVHQGTSVALTQKQYPAMALLRPYIDLRQRKLVVWYRDERYINISLDEVGECLEGQIKTCTVAGNKPHKRFKDSSSMICGQKVAVNLYTSTYISDFFTETLGVPCTLAKFPTTPADNVRHGTIRRPQSSRIRPAPNNFSAQHGNPTPAFPPPSIKLSNESPILLVSRSSVNRLNEQIKAYALSKQLSSSYIKHKDIITKISNSSSNLPILSLNKPAITTVTPATFRPNIVVAQDIPEKPYLEDRFESITIHPSLPTPSSSSSKSTTTLMSLGPCQRCQMVNIDQTTGERTQEPFVTLAKTRRLGGAGRGGGVWFGVHFALNSDDDDDEGNEDGRERKWLKVGDRVVVTLRDEDGDGDAEGE